MDLDAMYDDVRVDEENLGFCSGFVQGLGFITVSEILEGLVYMIKMIKMKLKHK